MKIIFAFGLIIYLVSCKNEGENSDIKNRINKVIADTTECENIKILKENINTDTITFDIGTQLFWNYNCDSAWLTYINKNKEQIVLDSWTENPEFSIKMGLIYLQDFKKKILFERNVISGCCDLPDNLIFDKKTGKELINIGPKIWYSMNRKYPLLICFDNSDILKDRVSSEFKKLIIYNLDNDKEYFFNLSDYDFFKDLKEQYINYDTNLLDDFTIENNNLTLKFRKEQVDKEGKFITQSIKLNLNNYCT